MRLQHRAWRAAKKQLAVFIELLRPLLVYDELSGGRYRGQKTSK